LLKMSSEMSSISGGNSSWITLYKNYLLFLCLAMLSQQLEMRNSYNIPVWKPEGNEVPWQLLELEDMRNVTKIDAFLDTAFPNQGIPTYAYLFKRRHGSFHRTTALLASHIQEQSGCISLNSERLALMLTCDLSSTQRSHVYTDLLRVFQNDLPAGRWHSWTQKSVFLRRRMLCLEQRGTVNVEYNCSKIMTDFLHARYKVGVRM
jgi:hypothetical protein